MVVMLDVAPYVWNTIIIDVIAAFFFYVNAFNRMIWVKFLNVTTLNAVDHSHVLKDERFIWGCRFGAVSSAIMMILLTIHLSRLLIR
jgi:hypothetical protein